MTIGSILVYMYAYRYTIYQKITKVLMIQILDEHFHKIKILDIFHTFGREYAERDFLDQNRTQIIRFWTLQFSPNPIHTNGIYLSQVFSKVSVVNLIMVCGCVSLREIRARNCVKIVLHFQMQRFGWIMPILIRTK